MPYEMYLALDQLWADLLLTVGLVLVLGSGVAIALCVLGGGFDFAARRRAARNQQRQIARSQQHSARKTTASPPDLHTALVEAGQAIEDGGLYQDTIQISEADEYSSSVSSGLIIRPLNADSGGRARPPLS